MIAYKLTNRINGKGYIGITTGKLLPRMKGHRASAGSGRNHIICRAIRKYGWENFEVTVLCEASSRAELLMIERGLIAEHGTFRPRGYNMTSGGDGVRDRIIGPETRKKFSEHAKNLRAIGKWVSRPAGWKATDEARAKMSASAKKKAPQSAETRRKIGLAHSGDRNVMRRDPDVVRRCAETRTGQKRTFEQRTTIRDGIRNRDSAKLDIEKAAQIRAMKIATGLSNQKIADVFGVSSSLVGMIIQGLRWAEILTPKPLRDAA